MSQCDASYLVRRVVVLFEVGMGQGAFDRDPFVRIEREHPVEQVERFRVRIRVEPLPGDLGLVRQRDQVGARLQWTEDRTTLIG